MGIIFTVIEIVIICIIVAGVYAYLKNMNFKSKARKMLSTNGIVLDIQSNTEYGIIGTDKSKKELIIIYPEIFRLTLERIPFKELLSCELVADGKKSFTEKEQIKQLELMIISKSETNRLHMFTFYSKRTSKLFLSVRIDLAKKWENTIETIIASNK